MIFVIKSGYAHIPSSNGSIPRWSSTVLNALVKNAGKITGIKPISTTIKVIKEIIKEMRFDFDILLNLENLINLSSKLSKNYLIHKLFT